MKYLIIDGEISGTGIRDEFEKDNVITPEDLGLSKNIIAELNNWLDKYAKEFHKGYKNNEIIESLDKEGISIAKKIQLAFPAYKISYFSDAKLLKVIYPLLDK